jgi:cell division protein ZipA
MSIFHRHADRKGGPVLFSVANALNPGTFDLNDISDFSTQGVCFFMTLPNVANNMLAFEQMLATAKHVQSVLDAELKDDNRSVMTAQTVEHYRQRIRDFDLQQLKNSKNPRQK